MPSDKKRETAAEFMARLHGDPEWARQNAEREALHRDAVAKLQEETRPEHEPLLSDLSLAGCKVDSIYDLVNTRNSYPTAIPVLVRHLHRLRHPALREGVARALTVPEARGVAGPHLLRELVSGKDALGSEERWALANALTVAADESMVGELRTLLSDARYADVHERLTAALKNLHTK